MCFVCGGHSSFGDLIQCYTTACACLRHVLVKYDGLLGAMNGSQGLQMKQIPGNDVHFWTRQSCQFAPSHLSVSGSSTSSCGKAKRQALQWRRTSEDPSWAKIHNGFQALGR
jgi:hypothetical protein